LIEAAAVAFFSRLLRKCTRAAQLIENPRLFSLRRCGGSVDIFLEFDHLWFHELRINTVLDIGANTGQFALSIRALLPHARIISFEPLPDCFAELQRRMNGDAHFSALNVGLGDTSGDMNIERNEFSPASSFLPLNASHKAAFTFAQKTQPVAVKIAKLDDLAPSLTLATPYMAKIDVQGFEDRVIRGGEQTLRNADLLVIELSYEALYAGQPLFNVVYAQILKMDFEFRGTLGQLHCPRTGKLLQGDGIFVKIKTS
jgi:FkbM family methyltransferase